MCIKMNLLQSIEKCTMRVPHVPFTVERGHFYVREMDPQELEKVSALGEPHHSTPSQRSPDGLPQSSDWDCNTRMGKQWGRRHPGRGKRGALG